MGNSREFSTSMYIYLTLTHEAHKAHKAIWWIEMIPFNWDARCKKRYTIPEATDWSHTWRQGDPTPGFWVVFANGAVSDPIGKHHFLVSAMLRIATVFNVDFS